MIARKRRFQNEHENTFTLKWFDDINTDDDENKNIADKIDSF